MKANDENKNDKKKPGGRDAGHPESVRPKSKKKVKALLVGLGLDEKEGHLRITKGPNFQIVGGTGETHEVMQETAVKFNEELQRRGKRLEDIGKTEFVEIIDKVKAV